MTTFELVLGVIAAIIGSGGVVIAALHRMVGPRFSDLTAHVNTRIDNLETSMAKRIDGLEASLNKRMDGLDTRLDDTSRRLDRIETRLDTVNDQDERLAGSHRQAGGHDLRLARRPPKRLNRAPAQRLPTISTIPTECPSRRPRRRPIKVALARGWEFWWDVAPPPTSFSTSWAGAPPPDRGQPCTGFMNTRGLGPRRWLTTVHLNMGIR